MDSTQNTPANIGDQNGKSQIFGSSTTNVKKDDFSSGEILVRYKTIFQWTILMTLIKAKNITVKNLKPYMCSLSIIAQLSKDLDW